MREKKEYEDREAALGEGEEALLLVIGNIYIYTRNYLMEIIRYVWPLDLPLFLQFISYISL